MSKQSRNDWQKITVDCVQGSCFCAGDGRTKKGKVLYCFGEVTCVNAKLMSWWNKIIRDEGSSQAKTPQRAFIRITSIQADMIRMIYLDISINVALESLHVNAKLMSFWEKDLDDGDGSNMRLRWRSTLITENILLLWHCQHLTFKLYQIVSLWRRSIMYFGWKIHPFSDGDRAGQPTGGGGGLRERGGAADVLHPARSASRRCCPHPCSVSIPYSFTFTRAHPWSADIPYSFSFTRADVWTIFILTSLFTVFEIIFCLGIFSASKFQFHCHFQFHWTSSLFSFSLLHWKYSRYMCHIQTTQHTWYCHYHHYQIFNMQALRTALHSFRGHQSKATGKIIASGIIEILAHVWIKSYMVAALSWWQSNNLRWLEFLRLFQTAMIGTGYFMIISYWKFSTLSIQTNIVKKCQTLKICREGENRELSIRKDLHRFETSSCIQKCPAWNSVVISISNKGMQPSLIHPHHQPPLKNIYILYNILH